MSRMLCSRLPNTRVQLQRREPLKPNNEARAYLRAQLIKTQGGAPLTTARVSARFLLPLQLSLCLCQLQRVVRRHGASGRLKGILHAWPEEDDQGGNTHDSTGE